MSWLDEQSGPGVQRSVQWFEWRKKHIGASDVPAVMGECDFKKPHELWLIKTGKREPFAGNSHTQRGIDSEPLIRKLYEERVGFATEAPVLEWAEWPVLSASLDAWNDEHRRLAEFKACGAVKHAMALDGVIPKTYRAQLQVQMLITGVDECDYVSLGSDNTIAVVTVKADKEYQARIVEECKKFWHFVENDIEPPGGVTPREGEELAKMAERFYQTRQAIREHESQMEYIRGELARLVPEQRASFYGLTLTRSKTGAIIIK